MIRQIPFLMLLLAPAYLIAEEPRIRELKQQRVGEVTYFRVTIAEPRDLSMIHLGNVDPQSRATHRRLPDMPRLIPQDDKTKAVNYLMPFPQVASSTTDLEFLGKAVGDGEAKFVLLYPIARKPEKRAEDKLLPDVSRVAWVEKPITLTLRKIEATAPTKRTRKKQPDADDLEGQWAEAQARQFSVLEAQTTDIGFYTLAREAMGRKYDVPAKALAKPSDGTEKRDEVQRLYELTTGATALSASLAMHRLLGESTSTKSRRKHDINSLRGIDIPEHPWKRMMGDKKPADEPLAKLVPHDHYYVAFSSIRKFLEFGDLIEQWGSPLIQGCELIARDDDIKKRYEKQLCLRSTALGRTLGPALIRGVAVTGSDLYLREGSDVSVIFHVRDKALFLAAVNQFIGEARTDFGKQLDERKATYQNVAIESFVTPLREISLHRAAVGDFVIYSNSGVALRRILDVKVGKTKSLSESLDFRYMRTVFRADDEDADGFAFLSDAFIRQLVGSVSKIKEKRRLEALTSLHMVTQGALFHAWDTGKLPPDIATLLKHAPLTATEIAMPEGKDITWDAAKRVAVSDVYNTIHFLTPLIELPIDRISTLEKFEYELFRNQYLRNWRQYFDPVGVRVGLKPNETKLEMYILPLVQDNSYNLLRGFMSGGTSRLDPRSIPEQTLFQATFHLNGFVNDLLPYLTRLEKSKPFGDTLIVRFDDGPGYHHALREFLNEDTAKAEGFPDRYFRILGLAVRTFNVTMGVKIGNERDLDALLVKILTSILNPPPDDLLKRVERPYRGTMITEWRFHPEGQTTKEFNPPGTPAARRVEPGLFWMKYDGYFYVSLSRASLNAIIDQAISLKEKRPTKELAVLNSGVYLSPKAAIKSADVLRAFLEWETHKRAVVGETLWLPLYRAGLIAADAKPAEADAVARHFLGFVPSSPDGSKFRYDARLAEVVNVRHGNLRQPKLNETLATTSPLVPLLEQMQWLRADLRSREDGIHTTVTLRKPSKK